jgi:serine/threonine protein kinase
MPILMDDFDADDYVSATWEVDENGTLRHNPSGMRVSPDEGVVVDGQAYSLSPKDIELDRDLMLGAGTGGVVQMGHHKPTGMRVAIKTVKVDIKQKRQQMMSEIKGLISAAGCPYLVQWYAGFVAKDTSFVHVVLELMDRGNLGDLRRRLAGAGVPVDHLACISAQIVRGLRHLRERSLLHRDVKPENILHSTQGQVKLTDFGISKDVHTSIGMTFIGTANYMSPERASGREYSFQSDIWSAGMVIYELATSRYPYQTDNFLELYECLTARDEPRLIPFQPDGSGFPDDACSFVAQALTRDEAVRPDAMALEGHEFIANVGQREIHAFGAWVTPMA